jgi:hypothetical protein
MITVHADVSNITGMVRELKAIDPKLVNTFRKELKSTAKGVASLVVGNINRQGAPLSGMTKPNMLSRNRADWGGAIATIKSNFAARKGLDITPLLAIEMKSPKGSPGYSIAEVAGHKNPGGTSPQGAHFIAMITERRGPLKGKGGNRIAWRFFVQHRATITRAAVSIVDKFSAELSRDINA